MASYKRNMEAGGSSSAGGRKRGRSGGEEAAGGVAHNQSTEAPHIARELVTGVVTGALGSLLPKLGELLTKEYNLHKNVKKDIWFLQRELESMHAALLKVGEVPRGQLDRQVKLWAGQVRDLSYDMEDVVDKFLVRVEGGSDPSTANYGGFKGLMKKMVNLFKKVKTHHQIADAIKDIMEQVKEVAARRERNKVDGIAAQSPAGTTIDPRLRALYTEATELVGVYGKRDRELLELLFEGGDDISKTKLKTVSIVGFGGLGKTTLAKAVYDKIKGDFDCSAFVPVGRNPDVKKIFRDILIGLDKQKYTNMNLTILDEPQLIDELLDFLENQRYLVIIDDIWDEKLWGDIKLAFSNMNNLGSRLITTTRIASVSKACCPSTGDSVYQMKPLSDDDSTWLFRKRIFSSKNECPSELEIVSRDILKKCGGVPLAIITIASLLASVDDQQIKPKDEWHVLLRSIGRGLTEDASMEEMQRILSFSYYDLPSHLKTCLLYLSTYPEDHTIYREELIWKWICQDFVQHGKQGTSIFEVGETYFNELINRSMIQAVYDFERNVIGCRVHDMVLDLICSLSGEENFVTILDGNKDSTSSQGNARRLSLQNIKEDQQTTPLINSMSMSQVRSITVFSPAMNIMPAVSSFDVLRVLDLSGCDLSGSTSCQLNFRDVGYLFHLRYLDLRQTGICELPAEIGNLQFLQVLDLQGNSDLRVLPTTVRKLTRLMILKITVLCKWFPDVLGNLILMEVLQSVDASLSIVQELGNLARLRELVIQFSDWSPELEEAYVESICNLHNIRSLGISCTCPFGSMDLLGHRWVPPRHLRKFRFRSDGVAFSTLPVWIKRCDLLSNLSEFTITVKEVQQEDVRILGRLPALRHLSIWSTHQTTERLLVVGGADGSFRCLIWFALYCEPATQVVFEQGALPMAEQVQFNLGVRVAREDGNGDHFELGLGNLLSLQGAIVGIHCDGVTVGEAKRAKAAVRSAFGALPNDVCHVISMVPCIPQGAHDDDVLTTKKAE